MEKKKIYFAHPVSHYGQAIEKVCLRTIDAFCELNFINDVEIINPNEVVHHEAYKQIGMDYFKLLVRKCDILIAMTFYNGEWGTGVWTEAMEMHNAGGNTYRIVDYGKDEWKIIPLNPLKAQPLSVEETRDRVRRKVI